jgi:two-component system CheB/CheR fusion protein
LSETRAAALEELVAANDLEGVRRVLKATVEELEASNAELRSANEQLTASNEELRSANEALELLTDRLTAESTEAEAARSDLVNLMGSTRIATIVLARDLSIRSFTPAAKQVFRLAESEVGRSISDVRCHLVYDSLEADAREVVEKGSSVERAAQAADGRSFTVRASPYRSANEAIEGVVFTFVDVTRLRAAEERGRRLATVMADSNDAVTVVGPDGHILDWNRGAERMYGYRPDEAIGRRFDMLLPADSSDSASELLERGRTGATLEVAEAGRRRHDGSTFDVSLTLTPVRDTAGRVEAFAMTERDITQQKGRRAHLEFLLSELDHRVRNTLALIQAVIDQLVTTTASAPALAEALKTRISGIAAMHEALRREKSAEVDAVRMVRMALAPHVLADDQIEIQGSAIDVPTRIASPVFMALHELAINAKKHGALSVPGGRVVVDVEVDPDERFFDVVWKESDGPAVARPARRGLGMTVIKRGLEYEAGGSVDLEFEATGLRAKLRIPLDGGQR